ncbi:MAG TPA: hypothetical protein VNA17_03675 [Pyrinomonadaceae bacterium]|nr:hypothetical protein [Pyrinomonadaceae bacterium]
MKNCRSIISIVSIASCIVLAGCLSPVETTQTVEPPAAALPPVLPSPVPSPAIPNLQAEILDGRFRMTTSPIGKFDFRNYSYEPPRGWQNPDGSPILLTNGRVAPVSVDVNERMSDEEKAERKAMRRIGLSYVATKYFDVTGDGEDEALVILKIETGGTAIPQLAYLYKWKDGEPELLWVFRTGDRADGGLKDIRAENGEVVVELYGQDRFILGQVETGKITGDEEQLCCPTHFTRSHYKWNGSNFLMNKKRLTYMVADPTARPLENLGDIVNNPVSAKK